MSESTCAVVSPLKPGILPLPEAMVSRSRWSPRLASFGWSMGGVLPLPWREIPWQRAQERSYTTWPGDLVLAVDVARRVVSWALQDTVSTDAAAIAHAASVRARQGRRTRSRRPADVA